jgi:peroxiredoxin Q/BCP
MSLKIGDTAPDFTLPTDGGGSFTLSAQRGRKIVLYFYPKDDTSGCTKEACGFRDTMPDFSRVEADIVGVSRDGVKSHDKFKAKYALPFTLVADEEGKVCEAYGVWVEKSMYGRKYMGIERTTVLIDAAGKIRGLWPKVKIDGHVEAVLDAAQAL